MTEKSETKKIRDSVKTALTEILTLHKKAAGREKKKNDMWWWSEDLLTMMDRWTQYTGQSVYTLQDN